MNGPYPAAESDIQVLRKSLKEKIPISKKKKPTRDIAERRQSSLPQTPRIIQMFESSRVALELTMGRSMGG
jgi:hypothetical protein